MKQKIIIPSLIIIVVLGILYLHLQLSALGLNTIPKIPDNNPDNEDGYYDPPPESDEPPELPTNPAGGSFGGSNEGGGGSQGSTTNPGQETICTIQPLPYALRRPSTEESCNSYNGETCIDKTVNCEVQTHNLESTNSGDFEMRITVLNENNQEIFSTIESKNIQPNSFETYTAETSFQDENAQQELQCFFNTITVPTGEICS
jgi:hypothetical protein